MFRSRFEKILYRRQPLFVLDGEFDWTFFEKEFGVLCVERMDRPVFKINEEQRKYVMLEIISPL